MDFENQNFKKLAQAMDLMIEDHDLYQFANRIRSQASNGFSLENIGYQWLKYLKLM
jgi:glycosyltransferase involved in cell wall biosynthesis